MVVYGPDLVVMEKNDYSCMVDDVPDKYLNSCPVLMACYPNSTDPNSTDPGNDVVSLCSVLNIFFATSQRATHLSHPIHT